MADRPLQVLLVDGDRDNSQVVRRLFSELPPPGCNLRRVSSFEPALREIQSGTYDACLFDEQPGGRTGFVFMEEALKRGIRTPIILLSDRGTCESDPGAIHPNAADCLPVHSMTPALLDRSIRSSIAHHERKEELLKAQRATRILSECYAAAIRIKGEMELLTEFCRIVVEVGGYRMAWVGYTEQGAEQTVSPVAWHGLDEGYLDGVEITRRDIERGRGPTGTSIRTGSPSIIHSIEDHPAFEPWRAQALKRGYASAIGLPLPLSDRALGALTIYASHVNAFDDEEVDLLTKVCGNLSFGIEVLRTQKARAHSEESLRRAYLDMARQVEERTGELVRVHEELKWETAERKRAEEGKKILEALMESIPEGITIADAPAGTIRTISNFGQIMLGRSDTELKGEPVGTHGKRWKAFHSDGVTPASGEELPLARTLRYGKVVKDEEWVLQTSDGRMITTLCNAAPIHDEEGNITGGVVAWRDITERKRAEQRLRASEILIRDVLDSLTSHVAVLDAQGLIVGANEAWKRFARENGSTDESCYVGVNYFEAGEKALLNGPDPVAQEVLTGIRSVMDGSRDRFSLEYPCHSPKEQRWFRMNVYPLSSARGGVVIAHETITERMRMENAVRESEHRYHSLFEGNQSMILLLDPQTGRIVDANASACRFYGFSRQEMIERKISNINILPKDEVFRALESARSGECGHFFFQHLLAHGEIRHVEVYSGPIRVNGEEVLYSIIHDITDRKMVESALVRREIELESKTRELEGVNGALKIILKKREENEEELKESVLANAKEMVLPYIEKLRDTRLTEIQQAYLNIVESNLSEICSPFLKELSSKTTALSPMEIRVAGLIKDGKSSKEISKILGVSLNTILSHRYRLRMKLEIKNEKINLRSHLNSGRE